MGDTPITVETGSGPMWGASVGLINGEYELHVLVPGRVVGVVAVRLFASGGRGKRFFSYFF